MHGFPVPARPLSRLQAALLQPCLNTLSQPVALPAPSPAANAPVVPPLDVSALPGPAKGPRVPSPSALGKRTRAAAAAAEGGDVPASGRGSPSKLRSAFQRHQQRSAG